MCELLACKISTCKLSRQKSHYGSRLKSLSLHNDDNILTTNFFIYRCLLDISQVVSRIH